jgi:hypothetical protein
MCESSPTPLARLSQQCADCLRPSQRAQANCASCRELAYRALCDGNEAAWDLLLVHLWPLILRWLYAAQPELTPRAAQALGYRALRVFRNHCASRSDLATNFPAFPTLLAILQRCVQQVIALGPE